MTEEQKYTIKQITNVMRFFLAVYKVLGYTIVLMPIEAHKETEQCK